MSQSAVAAAAGISLPSYQRYEAGHRTPEPEVTSRLATALTVLPGFFERGEARAPALEALTFRARTRIPAADRELAVASAVLASDVDLILRARFALPTSSIPDYSDLRPAEAAMALRGEWKLGVDDPVPNLVHLLERAGVRVFSLARATARVDAFSWWNHDAPFVFLNPHKSGERGRFDAAHELAHVVLHRSSEQSGIVLEDEANAFASSFLMPESAFAHLNLRFAPLEAFVRLKSHFRVSLTACLYRAHRLALISDSRYKMLMRQASINGYRSREPDGMAREQSRIFDALVRGVEGERLSMSALAQELGVSADDIHDLFTGLTLVLMPGERSVT